VCKTSRRAVAEELCVLYHEAIRSEVAKVTKSSSKRVVPTRTLDEIDKAARKAFIAAARSCIELEADARDFVVAQFSVWREASAYHKKTLWPSPHHFATLAAKIRYLQHKAREDIRISRVINKNEDTDDKRRWYVEERNLKGLARIQRRDPLEVLSEQPERFSREFLKHKQVWDVVKDVWEERQND
jgi:peroxiredoxin